MNQAELTLFSTHAQTAGFRLQRFEVFNWGTFHETVNVLPLLGENALLTGANGAGKTTLVDALIALLNPTPERYFNQSAGMEDRKRTRKVEDYVRGVYGHSQSGREQLRDLPDKAPAYTVLLGVFYNNDLKQYCSLAHLYWFRNGELKKYFYTAPLELNIDNHFQFGGDIRNFNAYLSKNLQARSYDSFQDFALDFQPKLGMRLPEKANNAAGRTKPLHLLAKTAGIKVLGNLDSFIREQMLDETNMEENFDQLKKEYADIAETQQTLEKLTLQEQMLRPLLDKNSERLAQLADIERLEMIRTAIGPWFAKQFVTLLETKIKQIQHEKAQKANEKEAEDSRVEQLQQQITDLNIAIADNAEGKRIRDLQTEKKQREAELSTRRSEAERYAGIAQSLNLVPNPDAAMFFAQKAQLEIKGAELLRQKEEQQQKRDELGEQRSDILREAGKLERELQSLRKRSNNLPSDLIECRDRLVQAIGATERDLPFAGELLQVRAEERPVWEQALEKLLRPFPLYLLVPSRYLRPVIQWVRGNNTGVLLRFLEADDNAPEALQSDRSNRVAANKLEVNPRSPFANWLQNELNKRYPHYCTEDNAEYEGRAKALTPEGLYKSDRQHQKDDRFQRSNTTVMGWDNADKVRQLERELRELNQATAQLEERIRPIKEKIDQCDQKLANLQRLNDFSDFKTMDALTTQTRIEEIVKEIDELTRASSEIKILKQQLDKLSSDSKAAQHRRDETIRTQTRLEQEERALAVKLGFKRNDLESSPANPAAVHLLGEYLGELPEMTLDIIENIENERKKALNQQINDETKREESLRLDIERAMKDFKQPAKVVLDQFPSWPDDTDALGSPLMDNVGDYLALLEHIQSDQLPQLRDRYQARASQDIGNAMQAFQRRLEDLYDDHRENIDNINQSLRALPYSQGTYLQVVPEDNRKKGRIGQFYQLLKSWDYDRGKFHAASEAEKLIIWKETVQKIGDIIKQLEQNEQWRKEVTDVRNWLGFKTQQYYLENNAPVSGTLLDGTGGKSGGEQAKLTYTVLAAALTYQFNIGLHERNARSFRFIVVDEAFSKLDPENSAYLLDLLSKLRFQMLIITPNTGVAIGEKYMSHLIFVKKESETPPLSVAYCYSVKEIKNYITRK
jgi:uncharacterized protein YPO0396